MVFKTDLNFLHLQFYKIDRFVSLKNKNLNERSKNETQ